MARLGGEVKKSEKVSLNRLPGVSSGCPGGFGFGYLTQVTAFAKRAFLFSVSLAPCLFTSPPFSYPACLYVFPHPFVLPDASLSYCFFVYNFFLGLCS